MGKAIFNKNQLIMVETLIEKGEVDVKELAGRLKVTQSNIYYYYNNIKNKLELQRVPGKIVLRWRGKEGFDERSFRQEKIKVKIATYIVQNKIIMNGDIIFLDCGTTNLFVADQIIADEIKDLTIITTNPYALMRLIYFDKLRDLYIIGGVVNPESGGICGPWTAQQLDAINYQFQKSFLGVDG
ncbi:MAG: hypothetical protein ACFFDN_46350, partial [Candidatus Hodarchaeota archaeon]